VGVSAGDAVEPRAGTSAAAAIAWASLQGRWTELVAPLTIRRGGWRYSRGHSTAGDAQGWKLHVSATIHSATEVLGAALPILNAAEVPWKVPRDLEHLAQLNRGAAGNSQVGKFLTIYPRAADEAVKLARELHLATRGMAGPAVPFDRPFLKRSLIYYRYGCFRPAADGSPGLLRRADGKLVRDRRAPDMAVPRWVQNPFDSPPGAQPESSPLQLLLRGTYLLVRAHSHRGKGAVYEALDLAGGEGRSVIIKEGRRHGETDWSGVDGAARVRWEGRVLRKLRDTGIPVPEVLEEFTHDGTRYLVLERIDGRPVRERARPSWRSAANLLAKVAPMLDRIHAAGYVWRDCKPAHLLQTTRGLRVIDF
jgi:hypothetical protein